MESRSYEVRGYYDGNYRGLAERENDLTQHEMIDTVHAYCSNGDFVKVINHETGDTLQFDPDTWMECIDFGDVPESIKQL